MSGQNKTPIRRFADEASWTVATPPDGFPGWEVVQAAYLAEISRKLTEVIRLLDPAFQKEAAEIAESARRRQLWNKAPWNRRSQARYIRKAVRSWLDEAGVDPKVRQSVADYGHRIIQIVCHGRWWLPDTESREPLPGEIEGYVDAADRFDPAAADWDAILRELAVPYGKRIAYKRFDAAVRRRLAMGADHERAGQAEAERPAADQAGQDAGREGGQEAKGPATGRFGRAEVPAGEGADDRPRR